MDLIEVIDKLSVAIESEEYIGYLPRPIPHQLDTLVGQLGEAYLSAPPADRELLEIADDMIVSVLRCHGERLASRAVRERSAPLLRASVLSMGLAMVVGGHISREDIAVHCLPWRSSELMGLDPKDMFLSVAEELPEPGCSGLRSFSQRSSENRTLAVMRYKESEDIDGFRYERTW